MAKLQNIFAVSCLLVHLSSAISVTPASTDDSDEVNEWLQSLLENYYSTSFPGQDQQSILEQQSQYFTEDQVDYIKSLLAKMKSEKQNGHSNNASQARASGEDSDEEKQTTPGTDKNVDDSGEEGQTTPGTDKNVDDSGEEGQTTPGTDKKVDDSGEEGQTTPGTDKKVDDSGEEGQTTPGTDKNVDDSGEEGQTTPGTDKKVDDSGEEGQTTPGTDKNVDDSGEEGQTTPGTDKKVDDSDEEGQTTPGTDKNVDDSDEEGQTTPGTDKNVDDSGEEGQTTPGTDKNVDDSGEEGQTTPGTDKNVDDSDEEKQATPGTDDSDEEDTTMEPISTTTTTTPAPHTTTTPLTPQSVCADFKPLPDVKYYLHFNGAFWERKLCPDSTGFDYKTCSCCIQLETPKPTTTTTTNTTTTTTTSTTTIPETTTSTTTQEIPTTTRLEVPTTIKPSLELCNDCAIVHGVGYAPFPGYCDAYIQCHFQGEVPTVLNIRRCPSGQYWNQDKLTCDFEENVKCQPVDNCPNHKAIPGDWAAYLIFDGQNWTRTACPVNTAYNTITCGCTDKHDNNDDDSSHQNCDDKQAIQGDKTGFLQLTGNGWVRMPCPATVAYDEQTCSCTERLTPDTPNTLCPDLKPIDDDKHGFLKFNIDSWIRVSCPATLVYNPKACTCDYDVSDDDDDDSDSKDEDDKCKPTVSLTFDNNDATDSSVNQFWVNNTGVTFRDGKAYFNGKSRLTIPGLSNMEFGDKVYISMKYKQTSASSQQTLIANGDCQVRQSLAVCSGKEYVDFYAETTQQISLAKITVPNEIGTWQSVVYALEKDNLSGSVGANTVSESVKGPLDRRQRGLVIGGGGDCDNFHGVIDEVQLFLCKSKVDQQNKMIS